MAMEYLALIFELPAKPPMQMIRQKHGKVKRGRTGLTQHTYEQYTASLGYFAHKQAMNPPPPPYSRSFLRVRVSPMTALPPQV